MGLPPHISPQRSPAATAATAGSSCSCRCYAAVSLAATGRPHRATHSCSTLTQAIISHPPPGSPYQAKQHLPSLVLHTTPTNIYTQTLLYGLAHPHNHQSGLCHFVEMWKWGVHCSVMLGSCNAELWSCGLACRRSQLCTGISFSPGRPVATASGRVRQFY